MEYILETKSEKDWQKHLNQWKHQFKIDILKMSVDENGVTLLILRTKKEE